MSQISPAVAAQIATAKLGHGVTEASIKDLIHSNAITNSSNAQSHLRIDEGEFKKLIADTASPNGGHLALRVSVVPARPDPLGLICPTGATRLTLGVDYQRRGKADRWGWVGVWPVALPVADRCRAATLPVVASMKGWLHRDFIRRIVDHQLDPVTRRRWLITKRLPGDQIDQIFGGKTWAHIEVGPGPIAALEAI